MTRPNDLRESAPLIVNRATQDDIYASPIIEIAEQQESQQHQQHYQPVVIRASLQRWWILLVFSLQNFINATLWISFSPIQPQVQLFYKCSALMVNLLSIMFMAMMFPVNPIAAVVLDKLGIRVTIITGTAMQLVGSWLRYLGADPRLYWVLFTGQTLAAIAQPFIFCAPPKIASVWFKDRERTIATTVGSLANVLGTALGFTLGPLIMKNNPFKLREFMLVEACIVSGFAVLTLVGFKAEPAHPPSHSAYMLMLVKKKEQKRDNNNNNDTQRTDAIISILRELKSLVTSAPFLILLISFGIGLGVFNALSTLVGQITAPLNYSDTDNSVFGGALLVAGIIAAGIIGAIVDVTRAYKSFLVLSFVGVIGSLVFFTFMLKPNNFALLTTASACIGISGMSLLPIALECACEIAFPVGEGLAAALMMESGQLFGIIAILVMNALQDMDTKSMVNSCWFLVGLMGAGFLLIVFMKPDYKRYKAEKLQMQQEKQDHHQQQEQQEQKEANNKIRS